MIRVRCHTNLDNVDRIEAWPHELPERPHKGDFIRSMKLRVSDVRFELEIVRITWVYKIHSDGSEEWILDVELHLPSHRFRNISEFQQWYERICS